MRAMPSPFPYFGGKSRVGDLAWRYFGDATNYVEPFAGSLAVLLARPEWEGKTETVNELNPYIANWWRAVAADPDAVAHYTDWPVNEADLHARHRWLLNQSTWRERMMTDPAYYDANIAGWWVWGQCAWIGHGWCDVAALRADGEPAVKIPHLGDAGRGVHRGQHRPQGDVTAPIQLPHLGDAGRGGHRAPRPLTATHQLPALSDAGAGVHRPRHQLPHLGNDGCGGHRTRHSQGGLVDYFHLLAARLRRVRVVCGDWSRVMGPSVTEKHGMTAVFLDPPYETGSDLYGVKSNVAGSVVEWCKTNWHNPLLRVILCGYDGEFTAPADWRVVAWKQRAGYQSHDKGNAERERLWISPACLSETPTATQHALFDEEDAPWSA